MQFVPDNGIYVYFRFTDDASVMVIVNGNAEEQELDTARFRERLHGYTSAVNIESGAPTQISGGVATACYEYHHS